MHRTRTRLLIAAAAGLVAALLTPVPLAAGPVMSGLVGWIVGSLGFSVPLLVHLFRQDVDATRTRVEGSTAGRSETDIIVLLASLASLGAIALMLLGGGTKPADTVNLEALVTLLSVASAWLAIHTIYTLRYARHWFNAQPGCVDFNATAEPRFSDFAYLSFTLGMTYQVSDTNLRTPEIRALVLRHTLLSYLFGTVIVAATINLVVGLAK